MQRITAKAALLLAPMAVAVVVAGCGGGNDNKNASTSTSTTQNTSTSTTPTTPTAGKASTVKLSADPGGALKFTPASLQAKAGKVTLVMDNPSSAGIQHAVAVEGNGVGKDGPPVSPGGKSSVTVDLKPGKYQFYCPVDGHRAAGMEGTLTVK